MTHYYLGISLSSSLLKMVCLEKKGSRFNLIALKRYSITEYDTSTAAEKLKSWIQKTLPKDASITAVVALPESSIFLKELTLPRVKSADLDTSIFWEISTLAPIPAQEAVLQYQKIAETKQTITVATLVARDQAVDQLFTNFAKVGINLKAIEPTSLSFARITTTNLSKTTLLVSVDEDETNFIVLKNNAPVFSTSTSALLEKVTDTKQKLNLKTTASLATSAKQAVDFWQSKQEGKIEQVVITGDVLKYTGLASAIYKQTQIAAFLAKVKKPAKINHRDFPQSQINRFLIPYGAVTRLISKPNQKDINLFPKKELRSVQQTFKSNLATNRITNFIKLNIVFLIIFLGAQIGIQIWSKAIDNSLSQIKEQIQSHPGQNQIASINQANLTISHLNTLLSTQSDIGSDLNQIGQLTPTDILLTSVKYTKAVNPNWQIQGEGSRQDILVFYHKVVTDTSPNPITMPYTNFSQENENEFTINLNW